MGPAVRQRMNTGFGPLGQRGPVDVRAVTATSAAAAIHALRSAGSRSRVLRLRVPLRMQLRMRVCLVRMRAVRPIRTFICLPVGMLLLLRRRRLLLWVLMGLMLMVLLLLGRFPLAVAGGMGMGRIGPLLGDESISRAWSR